MNVRVKTYRRCGDQPWTLYSVRQAWLEPGETFSTRIATTVDYTYTDLMDCNVKVRCVEYRHEVEVVS
jgi:hypothetical protein